MVSFFGATRRICKERSDGIAKRPHADLVGGFMLLYAKGHLMVSLVGAVRRICKERSDGIAKRPHADLVGGFKVKRKPDKA